MGSESARARLRLFGAIAMPPVLLLAIVGAAVVGAPSAPPATILPEIQASPMPTPAPVAATVEFPTQALGLRVNDVATALDRSGDPTDTVLAVRGYVRLPASSSDCAGTEPGIQVSAAFAAEQGFISSAETFCERHAVLRPRVEMDALRAPRLNLNISVGAVMPDVPAATPGSMVAVVVIGRLSANADACAFINGCERRFDVDRLVWVDGLWRGPTTSVEPALEGGGPRLASRVRDGLASTVTDRSDALLLETLVRPATLALVDPIAAAALVRDGGTKGPIWYRRLLDTTSGPIPAVRWVAIDDEAGTLLASGSVTH